MDTLEVGFYATVVVYAVFLAGAALAHLVPAGATRVPRTAFARVARVPVLGAVARAVARHPASLGLIVAMAIGAGIATIVSVAMWLVYLVSIALAAVAALLVFSAAAEDDDEAGQADAHRLYYSIHGGGEVLPGYHVEADPRRPYL